MRLVACNPWVLGGLVGIVSLIVLNCLAQVLIKRLKWKAGFKKALEREGRIGISRTFAIVEQVLFFLVALAGAEMFGVVAAGWMVFKGIQNWAPWNSPANEGQPSCSEDDKAILAERQEELSSAAKSHGLTLKEYKLQLGRPERVNKNETLLVRI